MIISHKHKFIFFRNQKTASSTIANSLNKYLGPFDIQTSGWDRVLETKGRIPLRYKMRFAVNVHIFIVSSVKKSLSREESWKDIIKERFNFILVKKYKKIFGIVEHQGPAHTSASQARQFLSEARWDRYFKFVVARNPWERAVSCYHWKLHSKHCHNVTFKEFLKRWNDHTRPDPEDVRPSEISGWNIYTINDEIAVDYIAQYENLEHDINKISKRLGITISINEKLKSDLRPKARKLSSYYDKESIEIIRNMFRKEIEYFGYTPPEIVYRNG